MTKSIDIQKPWEWQKTEDEGCVTVWTLMAGPDVLCRFWYDKPPSADARLIEAAPKLLAACEAALALLGPYFGAYHQLSAAIANATGEEVAP